MTGHQKAVLWIGLILIVLNLTSSAYWKALKGTLFGAPPKSKEKKTNPGGALPGLPFIPIKTPAKASTGVTNA